VKALKKPLQKEILHIYHCTTAMWQYATNTHHKNAPTNMAINDLTNMWEPARQQHTVAINCFMDLINYINYLKCVVKIWQHIISYFPRKHANYLH